MVRILDEKGRLPVRNWNSFNDILSAYYADFAVAGDVLKLDQLHVETVIPALGRSVLLVNGAYRGKRAVLEKLDEYAYCVTVRVDEGPAKGRQLTGLPYEDVCKLAL